MKVLFVAALLACAHGPALPAALELVETAPVETTLRHAGLREAWQVWPEMIERATARIDLGEFYATENAPSRLTQIIAALEKAAARGVRVRFLADAGFAKHETAALAELESHGVLVKRFDAQASMGGVMHAKYFVVDGREAYLGSQNFDWRSLEHVQELGVRFRQPDAVRALEDIFESDWTGTLQRPSTAYEFPQHAADGAEVTLVASPRGFLPDEKSWDLPALVELVDSAKRSVRLQALTYSGVPQLQAALTRAAARGVVTQLITSDWELRPKTLAALRALDPRIEVRILTIPQSAGGFIPYARVAHAKVCAVDGARGWVGTGNFEPESFYESRNVGLVLDGGRIPPQLDAFLLGNWTSQYAAPFDRARAYAAPRISLGGTHDAAAPAAGRRTDAAHHDRDEERGLQADRWCERQVRRCPGAGHRGRGGEVREVELRALGAAPGGSAHRLLPLELRPGRPAARRAVVELASRTSSCRSPFSSAVSSWSERW